MGIGQHELEIHLVVFGVSVDRTGPDQLLLLFEVFEHLLLLHFHDDSLLVLKHFLAGAVLVVGVGVRDLGLALFGRVDGDVHELRLYLEVLFAFVVDW